MNAQDRPGLLLICHGDLPDAAVADPECRRLYAGCTEQYELMASEAAVLPEGNRFSGLNGSIASFLSAESDGPVEQASLGFSRPGLREAMFRLVARGSRSIVCVGGEGLVLPGQGTSVHLPDAVGQVLAENAGLDLCCARPGLNPHVASALVMASIERALNGRGMPPGPSWEVPRIGGDTGVMVVSLPGPSKAMATGYVANAKRLSDYLRSRPIEGLTRITQFMSALAGRLEASGAFCAVRTGYLDYAVPDIGEAARQLADAGARRIIMTGMPTLLSRHMLSWADPDEAVNQMNNQSSADLVYVRPDPLSCAQEIAAMLRMYVLEAATAARQQSFSSFF